MIKTALRLLRQRSLLQKFALISLLAISLIGIFLGQLLRTSVERQVLNGAISEAEVVSRLALHSAIGPEELKNGLDPDRIRALKLELQTDFARIDVVDLVLWNLEREIVFATDVSQIGKITPASNALTQAFSSKPLVHIRDVAHEQQTHPVLRRYGKIIEVYQPVQFGSVDRGSIVGVLRTAIPYAPVAQTIANETKRLYLALVLAFVALYTVLFKLFSNASAELQNRADTNEHQARHDALTGLPNRTQFSEVTRNILDKRTPNMLAVALLDLDRFKEVNDTLGHHYGDKLLVEVARRLTDTLKAPNIVARLGGDEFALLLSDVTSAEDALETAKRVVVAMEDPFKIEEEQIGIGASIGVSIAPDDGCDLTTLLQKADVAMYCTKRAKTGYALYDSSQDNNSREQLILVGELRQSMAEQLIVYFQPKIEISSDQLCGVEALVRWDHPERGILSPDTFVPLVERSGLMDSMTAIVLEKSLQQLRAWLDDGFNLHMAVNISAQGLQDNHLEIVIDELLTKYSIQPELLILEITETAIATDQARAQETIQSMVKNGLKFSIDDFGTGYSSLAVLRSLPVNELKIDRMFINDLAHPDGISIVEYCINLGHTLGMSVVAEGVQSQSDLDILKHLGCDVAQGFWFARPMPADELTGWMSDDISIAA